MPWETAKAARTDSGLYQLRAPRRIRVADAFNGHVLKGAHGAGRSVPWDPLGNVVSLELRHSREYGPARTGKTIGLIDGWVIYNVICDPADMLIIPDDPEEKARERKNDSPERFASARKWSVAIRTKMTTKRL